MSRSILVPAAFIFFFGLSSLSLAQRYPYYIQDMSDSLTTGFTLITGVSETGVAVGTVEVALTPYIHAGVSQNSAVTDITPGLLDHGYSHAAGVNDSGYVVGFTRDDWAGYAHAFLYNSNSPYTYTDIQSNGILSNGQVIDSNYSSAWPC